MIKIMTVNLLFIQAGLVKTFEENPDYIKAK